MNYVFGFIVLILSISAFFLDRRHKILLLLISSMCLNFAAIPFVSFGTANQMICLFCMFSELRNIPLFIKRLRKSPIKYALLIVILSTFVNILLSVHAHNFISILGLIIGDLITKYFVIAYIYLIFKDSYYKSFFKTFYKCLIVLTAFGLLNLITKDSIVLSLTGNNFGSELANMDRMRVVALFNYPFDYGYTCVMSLFLTIYAQKRKYLNKRRIIICYICSVIGIFICGCRTIIVLALISCLLYYMANYSFIKAITALCVSMLIGIISYFSIPVFQEKINTTLTAFSMEKSSEDASSSLLGRLIQYDTAISYIQGYEVFGRGYRFFIEDLGYNRNGNGMYDLPEDAMPLLGLEGAIMHLILENGYFGVACYLLFYIILISYCFKLRKYNKLTSSLAAIILIDFLLYGNMTGELSSGVITFLLSGIFIKTTVESKYLRKRTLKYSSTIYVKSKTRNSHPRLQGNLS